MIEVWIFRLVSMITTFVFKLELHEVEMIINLLYSEIIGFLDFVRFYNSQYRKSVTLMSLTDCWCRCIDALVAVEVDQVVTALNVVGLFSSVALDRFTGHKINLRGCEMINEGRGKRKKLSTLFICWTFVKSFWWNIGRSTLNCLGRLGSVEQLERFGGEITS